MGSDRNDCAKCGKGLEYNWVEYVERECVPTGDGGLYIKMLVRLCNALCLVGWLRDSGKEPLAGIVAVQ